MLGNSYIRRGLLCKVHSSQNVDRGYALFESFPDDRASCDTNLQFSSVVPQVVAGDLNTDLGEMECDRRGAEISAALTEAGLEDMAAHFLPRKRRWGRERWTWEMVRGGKAVRSRTDYILGTDRSLFRNLAVRDPRYNSDHYMVMGLLWGRTAKAHDKYIAGRRKATRRSSDL